MSISSLNIFTRFRKFEKRLLRAFILLSRFIIPFRRHTMNSSNTLGDHSFEHASLMLIARRFQFYRINLITPHMVAPIIPNNEPTINFHSPVGATVSEIVDLKSALQIGPIALGFFSQSFNFRGVFFPSNSWARTIWTVEVTWLSIATKSHNFSVTNTRVYFGLFELGLYGVVSGRSRSSRVSLSDYRKSIYTASTDEANKFESLFFAFFSNLIPKHDNESLMTKKALHKIGSVWILYQRNKDLNIKYMIYSLIIITSQDDSFWCF
ncbi:hypothetical protein BpHYR1_006059 [Brachionus plicatilis]|uniref:Uncharacterized protein n=1 Tax=Brachionus plicatilis TaxID=10195 RepID=A0A3M7RD74_BRAPC|nr:hypothetical protein BpHYR1_006059 [Brachionus plicatilis]